MSAQDVVVACPVQVILKKLSPKVTSHPCRQLRQTESAYHILCWSFAISRSGLIIDVVSFLRRNELP